MLGKEVRIEIMNQAIEEILGKGATQKDAPWNKPIIAGDRKAIKKAGVQARKIRETTDRIKAELENLKK